MFSAQPYILDIDLDHFAAGPVRESRAPWAEGASSTTAHHAVFPPFPPECFELMRDCRRYGDARCDERQMAALEAATFESGTASSDGGAGIGAANNIDETTNDDAGDRQADCASAFARWVRALRAAELFAQRRLPPGLHPAELALAAAQGNAPHPLYDPAELAGQLGRLEDFLRTLANPPAVVTIARSVDGYCRIYDVGHFEAAAIELIERVFGVEGVATTCVRYAKGVAPLEVLLQLGVDESKPALVMRSS